jgi:hypothetical protein
MYWRIAFRSKPARWLRRRQLSHPHSVLRACGAWQPGMQNRLVLASVQVPPVPLRLVIIELRLCPRTPDGPSPVLPRAPNKRGPLAPPASSPRAPHTTGIRSLEFVDIIPDLAWRKLPYQSSKNPEFAENLGLRLSVTELCGSSASSSSSDNNLSKCLTGKCLADYRQNVFRELTFQPAPN